MQSGLLPTPSLLTRITPPSNTTHQSRQRRDTSAQSNRATSNLSGQRTENFTVARPPPREPQSTVVFHKSGMLYLIPEDKADEHFYDTLAFIYKPEGRLSKDVIESRTRMARCYIQHKKYGCTYPAEIMAEIERMKE